MNKKSYAEIFNAIDKNGVWQDDSKHEDIVVAGEEAVFDILNSGDFTKSKILFRLAGQSGSGKSTQLLPAILTVEKKKGNNPIIIGVRTFAKYHPQYDYYVNNLEKGAIREKTNGFALKCLCAAFSMLLEKGYMIALDLVIMDEWFESFILNTVKDNNYKVYYHILAVNIDLSNSFIEKRKNDINSPEFGKIVNVSSINLWYQTMPKGVDYLARYDKENLSLVWTAYDNNPIYCGKIGGAPKALKSGRILTGKLENDEATLLNSKIAFISKLEE